jgi:hypothetical protein
LSSANPAILPSDISGAGTMKMRNYICAVLLSGGCRVLLPRLLYAVTEGYCKGKAKVIFIYTAKNT